MKGDKQNLDSRKRVPPGGRASARRVPGPYRRHPIHLPPIPNHDRAIIIFLTVCTAGRRRLLDCDEAHAVIVEAWHLARTWLVGRYVIMPDHIHLFCAPAEFVIPSIERWMQYWKSTVSRNLGIARGTLWQRHFWDRQLRRGESYDQKWEYVRSNPLRHGLAERAEDWPYQGTLNELRW